MSSFNYTDNFSGFNDLINRAEILTEAKKSPYAGYHDSFGPITKELRSAGFSSAPLDTINFIRTVLYDLDIIDDDELAAAKRGSGFSAKKNNLLAVLDGKKKEMSNKTELIATAVKDGLAQYINRSATNRGREEKYAARAAALELAKNIKAGEDVGDAVDDAVDHLNDAEEELAQSLEISREDPTTLIEIKIRDADRVNDVSEIVTKYANEDGVDISGNTVQFSVDPGTPLAKAVAAHGIDRIEAALKRDVDKISDSVVVVMAPDEDYEEDMYGTEGDDSYEGQSSEVNEPIDENEEGDLDHLLYLDKEDNKETDWGVSHEEIDPEDPDYYEKRKAADKRAELGWKEVHGRLKKERAGHEARYKAEKDDAPKLVKSKYGMDKGRPGHDVYYDEAEDRNKVIPMPALPPTGAPRARLSNRLDFENEEGAERFDGLELDVFTTEEQPEDYIPSPDYEDVLDDLVNKDKKEHALKRLNGDGERHRHSPMLDSYQTSTAGYLTEQAASDKRNKKSEVKNQSFKERYQPKTHSQLEELKGYGL